MAPIVDSTSDVRVEVVAIHSDHLHVLVDQTGNAVRMPTLDLPHPIAIRGQPTLARLGALVERQFEIKGQALALAPGTDAETGTKLFLTYRTRETGLSTNLDRKGLRWRQISTMQQLSDRELSSKLQAALDLVRARRIAEELADSWQVKRPRVLRLFAERMAMQDGLAGWTQFLSGDSVGVLSTAQGILTFLEVGENNHDIKANLDTLRALQNKDGGWPVRRALIGHSERSITESTVYCLRALTRSGADVQDSTIIRGIEWLERAQRSDGGWGSIAGPQRARVYPTAFAAYYLATVTGISSAVAQASNWLREAQNADGGWGPLSAQNSEVTASTALHTAHALLALMKLGMPASSPQIESGLAYLRSVALSLDQEPWPSTSEVETVDTDAALDFRHFTTPWVICALLESGASVADPTVTTATHWLLSAQHSLGYWSSSLAPGQTPIWATYDAIHAIRQIRDSALARLPDLFEGDAKSIELDFAWGKYFEVADRFHAETVRVGPNSNIWMYAWNAVLTFVIFLILFYKTSLASALSPVEKVIGSALLGLVPGFGPFVYQLILDKISTRDRTDS